MAMTKSDTPNYRGQLFTTAYQYNPFLAAVLANGSKFGPFTYAETVESPVAAGSQDVVSEDDAITGVTPDTAAKTQTTNICQIQMEGVEVSLKKMAEQYQTMAGINNAQDPSNPDGLAHQQVMKLKKIANDMEFSLLQGIFQTDTNTATASQTRGITSTVTTNAVAAGSIELNSNLIDTLMKDMFEAGAPMSRPVAVCSASDKQRLDKIYGTQPESRIEGGLNLQKYYTALGSFEVIYTKHVAANTFLMVDLDYLYARWNVPDFSQVTQYIESKGLTGVAVPEMYDIDENGNIFNGLVWIPKLSTGASVGGWFYSHFGGEYGPETYHGKITGLTA
ncbi:MAG: hypothetical protein GWN64_16840 [Candidatus Thorarchaeota archaeon]|nr:hypothetical protein [Candidatus Thorarchaeota archaeon]